MSAHILIVDDEDDIRFLLQGLLEDEGYETTEAASAKIAREKLQNGKFDAVILDVWLQNGSDEGLQLLEEMKEQDASLPVIMISGHSTISTAVSAIRSGAYDFLEKPFKSERLMVMIKRAIEYKKLQSENQNLRQSSCETVDITGETAVLSAVRQSALKASESNSRIMIYGDDGSGKKTLARFIHQNSLLKGKPLNLLTCQNQDEKLMLSDLEESLRTSNGGTLMLNHVEKLPASSQDKLLYVLQSGKIDNTTCEVRVISLTTENIEMHVKEGTFKSDLYYRLNVVPLRIPTLKERLDDIEVIMDEIFKTISGQSAPLSEKLSSSAVIKIKGYDWPGNVRQLKNFIEWMLVTGLTEKDDKISSKDISDYINSENGEASQESEDGFIQRALELPLREARELFETLYLKSQIMRFDGNVSKTSEFVEMERSALHRKIKSLNIHKDGAENNVASLKIKHQPYEDIVASITPNTEKKSVK